MAAEPATPLASPNLESPDIEPTRAENVITMLSERLAATAHARNLYGEAVQAHGRTVIPVAKVAYGLGATSGGTDSHGSGGGSGGGGVGAKPAGYIEITTQGTRYVSFSRGRESAIALAVTLAAGYLLGRFSR